MALYSKYTHSTQYLQARPLQYVVSTKCWRISVAASLMPRWPGLCSGVANMTIETWITVALGRPICLDVCVRLFLESTTKLFLLFWTALSSIHDSAGLALPSMDWSTPQVKSGGSSSAHYGTTYPLAALERRQTSANSLTRLGSAASGRSLKSRSVARCPDSNDVIFDHL